MGKRVLEKKKMFARNTYNWMQRSFAPRSAY